MPWSCTSRPPKTDSTIAMTTNPTRSRSVRRARAGCPGGAAGTRWVARVLSVVRTGRSARCYWFARASWCSVWLLVGPYRRLRPPCVAGRAVGRGGPWPGRRRTSARGPAPRALGRRREDPDVLGRVGGRGLPEHLAVGEAQEDRAPAVTMPIFAAPARRRAGGRAASRAPSAGSARGPRAVGLLLQRGGRERRLLHRGVEQQQPDDAAEQHQVTRSDERHPRRAHARRGTTVSRARSTAASATRGMRERNWTAGLLTMRLLGWWGRTRSIARRRTEAARGFSAISVGAAFSAPRVTSRKAGSAPSGHERQVLGTSLRVTAVKACLTRRSSSEW